MGSSESSLSESQVQDMINDNVVSLKDGVSVDDICSNFLLTIGQLLFQQRKFY